jgi:nucleoside-diphosphate-sugar epimerase
MKKIFVTGGAGYCGSRLVPLLLERNYEVTVYDIMFFSDNFLPKNKNLKIVNGDIRDKQKLENACKDHDVFINLACISNDASFELDEKLSTSINLEAFEPMVKIAKSNRISRFIYASSSSVYGVSESENVTEEHPLVPLTLYNKYKGMCEPILLNHTNDDFTGVIFRPATVCGYSPRLRLDLSVNILTNHGFNNKKIKVFGGEQLRPNLHIRDYCDAILLLVEAKKELVKNQIFNVGYENMSIAKIALLVKKVLENKFGMKNIDIEKSESDDKRSYHINSDKIKKILNFVPKYSVEYAINELATAFKKDIIHNSFDNDIYYNVKTLKKIHAK